MISHVLIFPVRNKWRHCYEKVVTNYIKHPVEVPRFGRLL